MHTYIIVLRKIIAGFAAQFFAKVQYLYQTLLILTK
jgi:hypothetical protein